MSYIYIYIYVVLINLSSMRVSNRIIPLPERGLQRTDRRNKRKRPCCTEYVHSRGKKHIPSEPDGIGRTRKRRSVRRSIDRSILHIRLSIYLYIYIYTHREREREIHPSIHPSVHPSICYSHVSYICIYIY